MFVTFGVILFKTIREYIFIHSTAYTNTLYFYFYTLILSYNRILTVNNFISFGLYKTKS